MARIFTATKTGTCRLCNEAIAIDEHITWPRRGDNHFRVHAHCGKPCTCEGSAPQAPFTGSLALNGAVAQSNGNGAISHVPSTPSADGAAAAVNALAAVIEPLIAARVPDTSQIEALIEERINAAIEALPEPEPQIQRLQIVTPQGQVNEIQGKVHKQFKRLLGLLAQRKDVYLYGAPGGGKSTAVRQAAEGLGLPYYTISLNVQTADSKLMGYLDATGRYIEPKFREAYEKGGVYLVDEADNAAGNLLTSLNTALGNGHHAFPDAIVPRHSDFVCVGAGNTAGRGASRQHSDRRQFDAAFADRFFFLAWQYDEDLETAAALSHTPDAKRWVEWVQLVRLHVSEQSLHHVTVTPRASIEGAKLIAAGFEADRELADGLVFKGLESSQVNSILRTCPLPA